MKTNPHNIISGLLPYLFHVFLLCFTCNLIAQGNKLETDSTAKTNKSKKLIYIDNYIANFPNKNLDIYAVIKQIHLWDTTGVVPVISANTIMANRGVKRNEKGNEKEPILKDDK